MIQSQLINFVAESDESNPQYTPIVINLQGIDEVSLLLDSYDDIFEVPIGLPPKRECDHHIRFKDESISLKFRPCRYPADQKDVIERMTQEVLNSGVIRNITSSFAAPVVLVRKKIGLTQTVLAIEG